MNRARRDGGKEGGKGGGGDLTVAARPTDRLTPTRSPQPIQDSLSAELADAHAKVHDRRLRAGGGEPLLDERFSASSLHAVLLGHCASFVQKPVQYVWFEPGRSARHLFERHCPREVQTLPSP